MVFKRILRHSVSSLAPGLYFHSFYFSHCRCLAEWRVAKNRSGSGNQEDTKNDLNCTKACLPNVIRYRETGCWFPFCSVFPQMLCNCFQHCQTNNQEKGSLCKRLLLRHKVDLSMGWTIG